MEHNRKQKLLVIVALIVGIASLSIGFAAFSTTLNISSGASVTPSSDTFKVKFSTNKDSLVEGAVVPSNNLYNLVTTNGVIVNSSNPRITNLSATFTGPGQYVEYTFYARNEGEYTAYLNNISFIGNKTCTAEAGTTDALVQNVCSYINMLLISETRTYFENTPISGHSLSPKSSEIYKIRLEYTDAAPSADGPFSITFPDIALVYSTIDDSSIQPVLPEKLIKLESGDLNTPGSIVSIGDEKFYVFGQEDGNVKLLSMYNLHVGNMVDEKWNVIPLTNPTGIQDKDAIGYSDKIPFIGTTIFSNNDVSYSGSIVEGYVNSYTSYLEGLGANIAESRLIKKEELESLGCSSVEHTCSGAMEWVYATSYWIETPYNESNVWCVFTRTEFHYGFYDGFDNYFGVRPVIEVPLTQFE